MLLLGFCEILASPWLSGISEDILVSVRDCNIESYMLWILQIAQVHRARTKEGVDVVVKVQHKGIKNVILQVRQVVFLLEFLVILCTASCVYLC